MVVKLGLVLEGQGWFARGVPSEPEAGFDMFGVNSGRVAYRLELPFTAPCGAVDKAVPSDAGFVT